MIRVAAIGATATLALNGCACLSEPKASPPQPPPVTTQVQATEVMKNYSNNKANGRRDSRLLATIEDGDLFVESAAGYRMLGRLGDKAPYRPFTLPEPIAFAPQAGAYPPAFFVYSKTSAKPKVNVLSVFRRFDAATPWKRVVSRFRECTPPTIAVDTAGMATMVTPTVSGYAIKPIDVAPALAKAMLGAPSPEGVTFATSPILARFNKSYADERAKLRGKGTATRVV